MKFPELAKYFNLNSNNEIEDFNQLDFDGNTPLLFYLFFLNNFEFEHEKEYIDKVKYLLKKSNLNIYNKQNKTPLSLLLYESNIKTLNLTKEEMIEIIEKSDLNIKDIYDCTPLMYILRYNDFFNFENDYLEKLIIDNLLHYDDDLLYEVFKNNKTKNLNFSNKQLKKFLNKSKIDYETLFYSLIVYNKKESLNFSFTYLNYLYEKLKKNGLNMENFLHNQDMQLFLEQKNISDENKKLNSSIKNNNITINRIKKI